MRDSSTKIILILLCFVAWTQTAHADPAAVASAGLYNWPINQAPPGRAYFYIDAAHPVIGYGCGIDGCTGTYNLFQVDNIIDVNVDNFLSMYTGQAYTIDQLKYCGSLYQEAKPDVPCWVPDPDNPAYYPQVAMEWKYFKDDPRSSLASCTSYTPNCPQIIADYQYMACPSDCTAPQCQCVNGWISQSETGCFIDGVYSNHYDTCELYGGVYQSYTRFWNGTRIEIFTYVPVVDGNGNPVYNPPTKEIPPNPDPPSKAKSTDEIKTLLMEHISELVLPDPQLPVPIIKYTEAYQFKTSAGTTIAQMFSTLFTTYYAKFKDLDLFNFEFSQYSTDSVVVIPVYSTEIYFDLNQYDQFYAAFKSLLFFMVGYFSFRIVFFPRKTGGL